MIGRIARRLLRPLRHAAMTRRAKTASYAFPAVTGGLLQQLDRLEAGLWGGQAEILLKLLPLYLEHRLDLLGSGWVRIAHGEHYAGFGSYRYGPGTKLSPDWREEIVGRTWPQHRSNVRGLLAMISPHYTPFDWQVDFKSGWRWNSQSLGVSCPIGHRPGVDIKLPWELARLQHLTALAGGCALGQEAGFRSPNIYIQEFQDVLLDFIATNPTGWGVNWACAMDVAIRGANIVLAWNLFRALGVAFDPAFELALASSLLAHGRFVFANLEWHGGARANHYLANIAGLAFIAAVLPRDAETTHWMDFATNELDREILFQFLPDGGNFEGSTAYHGLAGELAVYAAALLAGQGNVVSEASQTRLAAVAGFSHAVTRPDGSIVQVGDNDSGRFFKLTPAFDPRDLKEDHLSQRGLQNAAAGLAGLECTSLEAMIVRGLAKGRHLFSTPPRRSAAVVTLKVSPARRVVRVTIRATPEILRAETFGDFGIYIWRGVRDFISLRCGRAFHDAHGGHAHNDQLSMEIHLNGIDWVRDPGSFVYTPDLVARNNYRRNAAHFAPRGNRETGDLSDGIFRLRDHAKARLHRFDDREFLGAHDGFGETVFRRVRWEPTALVIEDIYGGSEIAASTSVTEYEPASPADLATLWGLTLPYSPGYGIQAVESSLSK